MNIKKSFKLGILALVASVFVSSCSEEDPVGLFKVTAEPLLDTCYMLPGTAPAAQIKNVLLFDITGVRCSNCPKAAETAKSIVDANNGRVSAVALYADIPGLGALTAAWDGFPALNSIDAQQLIASLGNPGSLPTGCIDQIEVNNNRMISIQGWTGEVNKRLALNTPVNLELEATFNASDNAIRVNTKSIFTGTSADSISVIVVLTENDIESKQSENRVQSGHIDDYKHEHVLRSILNGTSGSRITCSYTAGSVAEKHYQITKEADWKVPNMNALVWVVNNRTKEVIHVQETSIK